jgi:8-oxo-dGTP pyrophosphatase MutT (NUDIX family)
MEELGIRHVDVHSFLDTTIHGYPEKGRFIVKTTHWYHMTTEATSFIPQTSEKITKVRWRSLRKAKRILGYDNLARLLARVEHKLVVTHP